MVSSFCQSQSPTSGIIHPWLQRKGSRWMVSSFINLKVQQMDSSTLRYRERTAVRWSLGFINLKVQQMEPTAPCGYSTQIGLLSSRYPYFFSTVSEFPLSLPLYSSAQPLRPFSGDPLPAFSLSGTGMRFPHPPLSLSLALLWLFL